MAISEKEEGLMVADPDTVTSLPCEGGAIPVANRDAPCWARIAGHVQNDLWQRDAYDTKRATSPRSAHRMTQGRGGQESRIRRCSALARA